MEERALPAEVSRQFFRPLNFGTLTLILVQNSAGGKLSVFTSRILVALLRVSHVLAEFGPIITINENSVPMVPGASSSWPSFPSLHF